MSQPQVQQRPVATNGVGSRRGRADRDVSNSRADAGFRSDSQNWRSSSQALQRSNSATGTAPGSGHGLVHFNSMGVNNNTNVISRHGERPDGTAAIVNRNSGDRMDSVVREGPLHQRLLYMAMSLIGQHVEVQVKNGSFYSGIFHTANVEKDFGIVLKMARLIQDGSGKGAKSEAVREASRRAPQKTLIIQAKDFVQMVAKDVSLSGDAMLNGRARENRTDIDTDATLSQGRHRDMERELKPWKPDDEPPRSLGLDSTFRHSWSRNWDQFEANKALFGVETTFNEELYTTKLERGPQMREREREASRIAREIEGTTTKNLHLAEERGIRLAPEFEEMDEESRFSSVIRRTERLDVGEDGEDRRIDDHNDETFGGAFTGAGSLASPTDSSVSTTLTGESESKASRPSSADSTQATDGPLQRDSSISLQERRASSLDKGEVAGLDSHSEAHREHWLRHRLVGDKGRRSGKGGGSPYHSPVGRGSPLMSPLVGDASVTQLEALNLDPSSPQLPEEVYRDFHEFKKKETAKQGKRQQREDQVNELKLFSESLKKKELEPRSPRSAPKPVAGEIATSSRHVSHEGVGRSLPPGDNKEIPSSSVSTGHPTAQASAPPASALPIPIALGGQSSGGSSIASIVVPRKSPEISTGEDSFDVSNGNAAVVSSGSTGHVFVAGHNGSPVLSSISTKFSAAAPAVPSVHISHPTSPTASPSSSVSSAASGAPFGTKKSTLNPNAKEFKLNPNAKSFTPNYSSQGSPSPMIQAPGYMHTGLPPVAQMQGVQVGISVGQYVQQLGQPPQFSQFNNVIAAASPPQFMQPQGGYVPPNAGVSPVLSGQSAMKMQPHSPQQVVGPSYGQQQQLRFPAQGQPVQPQQAYMHPNGQLTGLQYHPQMMYGQQPVVYMQYPQGQPVHPPPQGPLPPQASPQTQQQKHRNGGGMQHMHYTGGAPSFFPQPPLPSHLHNSLQPNPGGLPPVSITGVQPPQTMVPPNGNGGSGNAVRIGGKGGAGSFPQ